MGIKHHISGDDDDGEAWTFGASDLTFEEALSLTEHLVSLMRGRRAKKALQPPASGIETAEPARPEGA